MSTERIAARLVELCRQGEFAQAQDELYAADAVSIEPDGLPEGMLGTVEGIDAIREKGRQFRERTETLHSLTVSDALIAGNWFSVTMSMDITMKQFGRMTMGEVCVYRVHEDKIVSEQFFYDVG